MTIRTSILFAVAALTVTATASSDTRRSIVRNQAARTVDGDISGKLQAAEQNARQQHDEERDIPFAKLVRGNPALKEIALTFDDGPHGAITERLLDLLKNENVRATFFLVGKMVDRYPGLVRRQAAEGHEVANHTYDHLRLPMLPAPAVESQLREGAEAIERVIGSAPRLYRPPGGEYDAATVEATKRLGYVMVLWTDDPGDFARPSASVIEERILSRIRNGSIVLLHDGIPETLDMLPDLIDKLRKQGYRFVTISEMARVRGAIVTGGPKIRIHADANGIPSAGKSDTAAPAAQMGGGIAAVQGPRRSAAMRAPAAGLAIAPGSPGYPKSRGLK